jgi:hypothetical protein
MQRITLALLLLFSVNIVAQQGINYKVVIKDGSGVIVASTPIDVTFIILDGAVNVYEETHAPTTDANGIVILNIGEGTPVTGTFSAIDWSSTNHYLNVQIDTGGGLQDLGTTAFKTVPYAMHSATATTALNGQASGTNSGDMQYWNGSAWVLVNTTVNEGATLQLIGGIPTWVGGTPPVAIGDLRDGGVVFYVAPIPTDLDGDGILDEGLVCALSDYGSLVNWGCFGTDLPSVPNVTTSPLPLGSGAEIGDGLTNTNGILSVTDCPTSAAALAARSYGPEWFLPSAKELNEMYVNRSALEAVPGFAPFEDARYWSSTEGDSGGAWWQDFLVNGRQAMDTRFLTVVVRAVRAF